MSGLSTPSFTYEATTKSARSVTLMRAVPVLLAPPILSVAHFMANPALPSPAELAATPRVEAVVTHVVDGATIAVEVGGEGFLVSYLGLSPPVQTDVGTATADFVFQRATEVNVASMEGQTVVLERDFTNADADGRLLRWVWLGDQLANESIIGQGLAYADVAPPNNTYEDRLFAALENSRRENLGLWNAGDESCQDCAYLQYQLIEQAGQAGWTK